MNNTVVTKNNKERFGSIITYTAKAGTVSVKKTKTQKGATDKKNAEDKRSQSINRIYITLTCIAQN